MASVFMNSRCIGQQQSRSKSFSQRILSLGTEENIDRIHNLVVRHLGALNYAPQDSFAVELALEEAFRNATTHGNKSDPNKCVEVIYFLSKFGMWIRIEDEGAGFCPDSLPDPTHGKQLTQAHGRGVFLIRALMDRVVFNHKGNAIIFEYVCKHRNPS